MFFITEEEEDKIKTEFKLSNLEFLNLCYTLKIHNYSNFLDFRNHLKDLETNNKLDFYKNYQTNKKNTLEKEQSILEKNIVSS